MLMPATSQAEMTDWPVPAIKAASGDQAHTGARFDVCQPKGKKAKETVFVIVYLYN